MEGNKPTFAEGAARLAAVFAFLEGKLTADRKELDAVDDFLAEEIEEDRAEIACERCAYWPCVCGEPEFETWNCIELNQAAEDGLK